MSRSLPQLVGESFERVSPPEQIEAVGDVGCIAFSEGNGSEVFGEVCDGARRGAALDGSAVDQHFDQGFELGFAHHFAGATDRRDAAVSCGPFVDYLVPVFHPNHQ